MPVPTHTPCPVLNTGVIKQGVIQLVGEFTVMVVVPHPLLAVAVKTKFVPTAIPITVLPTIVPLDAVTFPVLLKLTL